MTYELDGYGLSIFNGGLNDVVDFIVKIGNYSEDKIKEIKKATDEYELTEIIGRPASSVIAEYINAKEGVSLFYGFDSCYDTGQTQMLGIKPMYPWEIKPENLISKEKVGKIFKKYAAILNIEEDPKMFSAQYCDDIL